MSAREDASEWRKWFLLLAAEHEGWDDETLQTALAESLAPPVVQVSAREDEVELLAIAMLRDSGDNFTDPAFEAEVALNRYERQIRQCILPHIDAEIAAAVAKREAEIVAWLREWGEARVTNIGSAISGGGRDYDIGRATGYIHAATAIERGDYKESNNV